ncbi:hypothetical protein KR222_011622 [Zaprionus bogoriensis]|nr:hypothetical protein KR222_011622 [Zaprionus bogoriensis]
MSEDQGELRRFLHWGPFTALSVTLSVSLTTWMWWPSDSSVTTSAHFGLFLLLNLLAVYNYVMAVLMGPGWLPRNWQPAHYREAKFLQYCKKCDGYKAPRSHHCRRCDRCVKKMDHHCPWINHCVGWANQSYFIYFLFFYMLSNLHAAVVLCCGVFSYILDAYYYIYLARKPLEKRPSFWSFFMCVMCFGMAVGIVLCMLKLLCIQLTAVVKNRTDIEYWILEKARCRRHKCATSSRRGADKPFVYPYDLGWYANLGQVFNIESQTISKGINWPVRKGCDPYALTREQLAQKADKRLRTRVYKCTRDATGSWLPILSQGLMVTVCLPCTDDPRIRLEPNDLIRVTRFEQYWLFGERVVGGDEQVRPGAIRGWFPRRCAVDVTESMSSKGSGEPAPAPENALALTAKKSCHKEANKEL